ncbi:glutathione S-transferase family protein [Kordiimonas sp. SCSIO 12610]|uniref:glutathione S-transferase family protein n=1 Tax=Kordiimonas sp. SCSIO 12610 TaxID=2829597 RepID=UPI00210DC446|nr:glutathione S-transferase family protein [Kordiimonas sp. SCSIO 12610]UTW54959.1 glutathione S-transferase family protein [Kordiimonas sp. SCSIO 12610]
MITLYWCPQTRAARAMWMLEELGVDYDLKIIDIRDEKAKVDSGFLQASPMGKVPALNDGEAVLADSAAICLYLADKYPEKALAPSVDDPLRAQYLYWMVYVPGVIEPAMAEKFSNIPPNKVSHGWGDFDTMISVLENALDGEDKGPWLLGDKFSAADVMVGSTANFLRMFNILPDSQIINDYIDRCLTRPAFERALAKDAEHALPS